MCDCSMHDWGTRMINLLFKNRENSKKNREKEKLVTEIIYRIGYLLKYDKNFVKILTLYESDNLFPSDDLYLCDFRKLNNKQIREEIAEIFLNINPVLSEILERKLANSKNEK